MRNTNNRYATYLIFNLCNVKVATVATCGERFSAFQICTHKFVIEKIALAEGRHELHHAFALGKRAQATLGIGTPKLAFVS